jgi:dihydrofolate reductase
MAAPLVFAAICSLDGYVVDTDGSFDWAAPDAEVHAHVNDLERGVGTHLVGRRTYEFLAYWDTDDPDADREPAMAEYRRLWRLTDKVVYSTTLDLPPTPRTTIARTFEPGQVRALLAAVERPVSIGGPTLAAEAFAAGLVDELHLYRHPVVVGGGTPALPAGLRLELELLDTRTFDSGVVHTHHRVRR